MKLPDRLPTEPRITINGVELTQGQAMTMRVALESFAMELTPEYCRQLGPIGAGYLDRIKEIRALMRVI